jgi:hypothetical protein
MPYVVEVDQSRKIEQSGTTVLAFSDGISHAIAIPSSVKSQALRALRDKGKPRREALVLLFATCLYVLFKDYLDQLQRVEIDIEYPGKDADIRASLLRLIWRKAPAFEPEEIVFRRVGKGSPADRKARAVRTGKDKAYHKITLEELLKLIE